MRRSALASSVAGDVRGASTISHLKRAIAWLTAVVCIAVLPLAGGEPASAMEDPSVGTAAIAADDVATFPPAGQQRQLFCPDRPLSGASRWAALGDSYSAGEGVNCYYPQGGNARRDGCHRSSLSWAVRWNEGVRHNFVACTGAVTRDITTLNRSKRGASIQALAIDEDTIAATITIGGNDVFFADIVTACLSASVKAGRAPRVRVEEIGSPFVEGDNEGRSCQEILDLSRALLDDRSGPSTLEQTLVDTYTALLARADGRRNWRSAEPNGANPNFKLLVGTYPELFPRQFRGTAGLCQATGFSVPRVAEVVFGYSRHRVSEFVELTDQLNDTIRSAVQTIRSTGDARIRVADIADATAGHTISCGDRGRPTPYINAINLASAVGPEFARCVAVRPTATRVTRCFNKLRKPISTASFHPRTEGHEAYAPVFARIARGAVPLNILRPDPAPLAAGRPYRLDLNAVGGGRSKTWTVFRGSLPPGLSLNRRTGVISGRPASGSAATIRIQVRSGNQRDRAVITLPGRDADPSSGRASRILTAYAADDGVYEIDGAGSPVQMSSAAAGARGWAGPNRTMFTATFDQLRAHRPDGAVADSLACDRCSSVLDVGDRAVTVDADGTVIVLSVSANGQMTVTARHVGRLGTGAASFRSYEPITAVGRTAYIITGHPDGTSAYGGPQQIWAINIDTGAGRRIVETGGNLGAHSFSPSEDGRTVVMAGLGGRGGFCSHTSGIHVFDTSTGTITPMPPIIDPADLPPGRNVYVNDVFHNGGVLYAVLAAEWTTPFGAPSQCDTSWPTALWRFANGRWSVVDPGPVSWVRPTSPSTRLVVDTAGNLRSVDTTTGASTPIDSRVRFVTQSRPSAAEVNLQSASINQRVRDKQNRLLALARNGNIAGLVAEASDDFFFTLGAPMPLADYWAQFDPTVDLEDVLSGPPRRGIGVWTFTHPGNFCQATITDAGEWTMFVCGD